MDVEVLKRVELASLVAHQLHTIKVRLEDVATTPFNVSVQPLERRIVPVLLGFVDDFVTTFHGAKLAKAQILLSHLQAIQVLLQAIYQVVCQGLLARITTQNLNTQFRVDSGKFQAAMAQKRH